LKSFTELVVYLQSSITMQMHASFKELAKNWYHKTFKYVEKNQNDESEEIFEFIYQSLSYFSMKECDALKELLSPLLLNNQSSQQLSENLLPKIKIKLFNKIISNNELLEQCEKVLGNLEHRLFNLLLNYYITVEDSCKHESEFIKQFSQSLCQNYDGLSRLKLKYDTNLEQLFIDFIIQFSARIKLIEVS
jgi:hypothetical protein